MLRLPLLLAAFPALLSGPSADERPNVILFLIDDQDKSSIGAYGGKTWTPNLDRMAREGMRFDNAHVSSTVCTPSRYAFFTGRYAGASTSKLYDQACGGPGRQGFPNFNVAPEPDRMNIARVLGEAGYATGFTGKFHLESRLDFPEFYDGDEGLRRVAKDAAAGPETSALFRHNERVMRRYLEKLGFGWAKNVYRENMNAPYDAHNPEWTVSAAVEFIEANKERPFYLQVCPTLLHGPDGSWRRSMDRPLVSGEGELKSLPAVMTPREELLRKIAAQGLDPTGAAAGEAWIDDALGAVLRKLKDLGIDRNTLVVFAADHGSRSKGSLFAVDGTAIPFIARWPARIPPGRTCVELVQNVDWVPTVFEAAGAKPPAGYRLDGRSLLPLLETGKAEDWRDHLYFEAGHARAIMTREWKYIAIRYPAEEVAAIRKAAPDRLPKLMSYIGRSGIGVRGSSRPGFWDGDQLYDLRTDPDEMRNVASDPAHADRLKSMRQLLTEDARAVGRPFGEFVPGGNAVPGGQVDAQVEIVRKMTLTGKKK